MSEAAWRAQNFCESVFPFFSLQNAHKDSICIEKIEKHVENGIPSFSVGPSRPSQ
jgi:hypothetical protein